MTGDHRHCDEVLASLEQAVSNNDWDNAEKLAAQFLQEMEQHLSMEEDVLFPAFEQKTGIVGGPTMVMRAEHKQMRELFGHLQYAVDAKDSEELLDTTETLLILMQQHNVKEEGMLYPMSDQHLGSEAGQVLEKMQTVKNG